MMQDIHGQIVMQPDTTGMMFPVQCRIYDLGSVDVTGRYADCSVWTTPCCKTPGVDDRPEGWGPRRRYVELPRGEG